MLDVPDKQDAMNLIMTHNLTYFHPNQNNSSKGDQLIFFLFISITYLPNVTAPLFQLLIAQFVKVY